MRVLPILFNTEMVRAILDGRKTIEDSFIRQIMNTQRYIQQKNIFLKYGIPPSRKRKLIADKHVMELEEKHQVVMCGIPVGRLYKIRRN